MQKAIYYVSKPIAARGMLELTDRCLYFQVFPFDASFGIKNITIGVDAITDVTIEKGDMHPKISIFAERKHEFVLSKGQQLYDRLKELQRNPLLQGRDRRDPGHARLPVRQEGRKHLPFLPLVRQEALAPRRIFSIVKPSRIC